MPQCGPSHSLRFHVIVLGIACAFSFESATAQTEKIEQKPDAYQMTPLNVIDTRQSSYSVPEATSATRTGTPIKETPLSVQVVDQALIKDKAITTPADLVNVVPGVQQVVGYGNTPSQWFIIRGFSSGAVNYRDGYRVSEIYTPRDLANVERVEFVKGPSSVLYGQAQPAGAVNTITKTPLAYDYNYLSMSAGSWSKLRLTADLNKNYSNLAVRLNLAADTGDSYVKYEQPRSWLIAPTATLKLTRDVELLYSGEFHRTRIDGFSNGLPMADGVFDLPDSATVSQPWARLNNKNASHRLELKVNVNDKWALRQGFYTSTTKRDYRGVSPAFNQFDGTPLADYPIMYNAGPTDDQRNTVAQTEAIGRFKLGETSHRLLTGFEYFKSKFEFAFYDQFGCDFAGNCFQNYTNTFSTGIPAPAGGFTGGDVADESGAKTKALYVNDQISWGNWRFMLGMRHDRAETTSGATVKSESVNTGRIGAMYLFTPETSVYYSAGQSFVPNLGARTGGGALDPEKGLQHEIGVKHTVKPGLDATFALYEITKKNVRYGTAGSNPQTYLTYGEQQSRGFEASLAGQLAARLKAVANFSYIDFAKVTKDESGNEGNALYGVPKTSWNLWGVYDLPIALPGKLSAGLGVVRVDKRPADQAGSGFKLPSYTRYDAGLFYKLNKFDFALNLKNIGDANIFDTVDGYFVQRQPSRSVTLTAGLEF